MIEEQNAAIVQAQVNAHFGPKPALPPKEKVPEKVIDHFIHMAREPAPKPFDSDYEHQIRKLHRERLKRKRARARANKQLSKNAGKLFPSWENRWRN